MQKHKMHFEKKKKLGLVFFSHPSPKLEYKIRVLYGACMYPVRILYLRVKQNDKYFSETVNLSIKNYFQILYIY